MRSLQKQLLLLTALIITSNGMAQGGTPMGAPYSLVGEHNLQTDYGEIFIGVSIAELSDSPSIDTTLSSIAYNALTAYDIILLYHDKLEFCTTGCKTKKAAGPPYVFVDVYNGMLSGRAFRNIPLHLEAECPDCTQGQIEELVRDFILQSFDIEVEYRQVPIYEVCQDVPTFLRHYHSDSSNFTSGISVIKQKYDSTHLNLMNMRLSTAIDYLEAHVNVLLQFNPDCAYYSRIYSKPFRIKVEGTTEEILADFAENHFVEINQIPETYYDAIIIKDSP